MIDSPLELFRGDEDLAEGGIYFGFSGVEAACGYDVILVIEDVSSRRSPSAS
jgi:hypothetical protein